MTRRTHILQPGQPETANVLQEVHETTKIEARASPKQVAFADIRTQNGLPASSA